MVRSSRNRAVNRSYRPVVELLEQRNLLSFLPPVEYPVGEFPRNVTAGDFRGIGRVDLAVANINSDFISVLLGNGDGTFRPAVNYPVDSQPHFVEAGDFDGDGTLDLLVTCSDAGTIDFLRGNGDGTFHLASRQPGGGIWPHRMVVVDLNGDGVLDVAMVNSFSDSFSVFLGNGDGTFRLVQTLPVPRDPVGIAAGSFNGDGRLDLAVASFDFFGKGGGNVQIFLGAANGTFTPGNVYDTGGDAWSVAAGDFNGDGLVDLAVTNTDGTVAVLSGVGDGTFKSPVYYPAGAIPVDVATADLRGDGTLDLVTANVGADDVSLLRGNGDGTFQPPESIPAGANPFFVLVKDLDGDGTLDLVTANSGSASISVILGDGPHSSRPGPGVSLTWAMQLESANTPSPQTTDRTCEYQMAEPARREPAQPEKLILQTRMRARTEGAEKGTERASLQRFVRSPTVTRYPIVAPGPLVLLRYPIVANEETER